MWLCIYCSPFKCTAIIALILFIVIWAVFRRSRGPGFVYFDPQDLHKAQSLKERPENRTLPISAATATFEPLLKHYISVMQLLLTVAAASIAFGGTEPTSLIPPIVTAKLFLAWSIFYGVLFCAILLWRYEEYGQDMESYKPHWYSTSVALGFSSLICFMFGYLIWGYGISMLIKN
jgi:hypothetical protein